MTVLVVAFGAGMLATVNPCGFAMLPAFVGSFLGSSTQRAAPAGGWRLLARMAQGVGVGLAVSAGFAGVFAAGPRTRARSAVSALVFGGGTREAGGMGDRRGHVLVIANGSVWSLGWLAAWFPEGGLGLRVVRPYAGEQLPVRLEENALVILPGEVGVGDDAQAPWQPRLRALVRRAVGDGVATLGICYGAQLLTAACGGRVAAGDRGPEIGLADVVPAPAAAGDPLFGVLPGPSPAVLWHHDVTVEPPPGAVSLAATASYRHAAYRLGDRAWAVQFHPEATVSGVRRWARFYAEELWTLGASPARVVEEVRARRHDLHQTFSAFVRRFAAVALDEATLDQRTSAGSGPRI